ncbi:unnamed protein product, partial [Mesorhabditis spiculigera]
MLTAITVAVAAVFAQDSQSATSTSSYDSLQCPCLRASNSGSCLPYDTRFQATTLEEAMLSFPDLSIDRNETAPEEPLHNYVATELHVTTRITTVSCTTQECEKCQEDLRLKLEQIGMRQPVGLMSPPTGSANMINDATANSTFCPRYRFTKKETGIRDYGEPPSDKKGDDTSSDSSEDSAEKKTNKKKKDKHDRTRRGAIGTSSTMTGSGTMIGTRFPLSCTTKGLTTDTSGYVSLCSSCWVWRKLPDNYNPQFINELVCDDSDLTCLSGYATCTTGHRTVEVVRNDSGIQTTVTLTAGTFCECKCSVNSAVAGLVTGGGVSGTLPAVAAAATTTV